MGSGALLSDDLVATSAHVVHDHATLQLILGDQVASGDVVAHEAEADLAIVRASRPLAGHVFTIAEQLPGVGSDVAAIGYPLDGPLSMAGPGIVGAYGERASYDMGEGDLIEASELMRFRVRRTRGTAVARSSTERGAWSPGLGTEEHARRRGRQRHRRGRGRHPLRHDGRSGPRRTSLPRGDGSRPDECVDLPTPDDTDDELVTSLAATETTRAIREVLFDYIDGINREDYERAYRQLS